MLTMCTTKPYLTQKELKEIKRRYKAGVEDSDYNNNLNDSGSEYENHEEVEEV